jgi:hypothetical protein
VVFQVVFVLLYLPNECAHFPKQVNLLVKIEGLEGPFKGVVDLFVAAAAKSACQK